MQVHEVKTQFDNVHIEGFVMRAGQNMDSLKDEASTTMALDEENAYHVSVLLHYGARKDSKRKIKTTCSSSKTFKKYKKKEPYFFY